MLPHRVEVVVVGAGPTGLTLACALRAEGREVLVLDQAEEGTNTSRAAVLHARTLEVLEELDVTARLLAEGCIVPVFTVRDRSRTLARIDFSGLPSRYPYTLMLPQSRTEAILGRRLTELGGQVHRPWKATSVQPCAIGAAVTATEPDGVTARVEASYVVGADGMHSLVRGSAGIAFTGSQYPASFVLADVVMDWPLPTDEVQLFFAAAGLVVVAPLPGGHHRIVATMDQAPESPGAALVQQLLDQRGPRGARVRNLVWASRFRVQHRVATAYRNGPLLLAGDAAHVHSPAGGQGMNTGIQDAIDLGRTLASVLRGHAQENSLDGYQERRMPIAQRVVILTDRATRLASLRNPVARETRNALIRLGTRLPTVQRRLAHQLAELPPTQAMTVRQTGSDR